MVTRNATAADSTAIHKLYISAFSEAEQEPVATLATDLAAGKNSYSYVAEIEGNIVGHIAFSPVTTVEENDAIGFILSPLAVHPDYQNQKVGSSLIKRGISQLKALGAHLLFVYGDPGYYGRFGFEAEAASGYMPPYKLQYPFGWQALKLNTDYCSEVSRVISCVPALKNPKLW